MSLVVWLPLNNNLENLGVSSYNITAINTPTYVAGKIGQCYQRANSNTQSTNGINIDNNLVDVLGTQASIAVWIKPLGTHTHHNGTIVSSGNWNAKKWAFGVSQDNSQVDVLCGGYNNYITCVVPVNEWTHLVSTFNNGTCKLYKNGVYIGEKTGQAAFVSDATNTCIGRETYASGYFGFNGLINDVRIYNHCLSAAEVREIAMGLVLHYKLDDTYAEMPTFLNCTINDTAYNGSLGKYGYNTTSNLSKTTGYFQGKNCIKISTITSGQNARPYSYFSNLFTSNGTNAPAYKALSFDYYTTCPTTTWLNIYKLGNGTGTATWKTTNSTGIKTGTYTNSSNAILVQPNEWNHVEVIFHGTTNENSEWGYCINGPEHTSSPDYYFLFANIQLEQNDHITGYGQSMHNSIITDSSGYGHNGTINGALTISSDTPRYNTSSYFGEYNTPNVTLNNPTSLLPSLTNCTITWWGKYDTTRTLLLTGQTTSQYLAASNNNTYYHSVSGVTFYKDGVAGSYKCAADGWHFFAMKNVNISSWTALKLNSYSSYWYLKGLISDFRIYCTPLLDTDIKLLYNVSMKVDNLQNLHTFEYKENTSNLFRSELIMPFAKTGYTEGNGNITIRNESPAMDIRAHIFYQNLENSTSGFLKGYFKANTPYVFDMWIDTDAVIYNGNNVAGGLVIIYTDGTSENTFVFTGGNKGWQHKIYITPNNKTIDRISVYYYVGQPVYCRLDSCICPLSNLKLHKTGIFEGTNLLEETNTKLTKNALIETNEIIEI